jgi:hypothetical protein
MLEQAQALYGINHAKGHTWSVIIEKTKDLRYRAHVIVYLKPDSLERFAVLKSSMKETTVIKALDQLMEVLATDISQKFFR